MPQINKIDQCKYTIAVSIGENENVKAYFLSMLNNGKSDKKRSKKFREAFNFLTENYDFHMNLEQYTNVYKQLFLLPPGIVERIVRSKDYIPDEYQSTDNNECWPIYYHDHMAGHALEHGMVKKSVCEREEEIVKKQIVREDYFEITEKLALPDYTGGENGL